MEVERRELRAFEILDHPADIGFRAFGSSLIGLFENCALALLSIRAEVDDVAPRAEYPVAATGADSESLLVNFLSEVLYLVDGTPVALRAVRVKSLTETAIEAAGLGEPRDAARHRVKVIVKAVTYHQLKIEQAGENWSATVFLDI